MFGGATNPESAGSDYPPLIAAATPELYRQNAFRITGLPVTAGIGEVRRHSQELARMKRLGLPTEDTRGGYLPLRPPPEEDQINGAANRLLDQETRLIDELFWFWPIDLQGTEDEGLALLKDNRIDDALKFWLRNEQLGSQSQVSTHNLAVLYHLAALDLEHRATAQPLTAEATHWRNICWKDAYRRCVTGQVRTGQ